MLYILSQVPMFVVLSADVRDTGVENQRHMAYQTNDQSHSTLSGHASICGQGG